MIRNSILAAIAIATTVAIASPASAEFLETGTATNNAEGGLGTGGYDFDHSTWWSSPHQSLAPTRASSIDAGIQGNEKGGRGQLVLLFTYLERTYLAPTVNRSFARLGPASPRTLAALQDKKEPPALWRLLPVRRIRYLRSSDHLRLCPRGGTYPYKVWLRRTGPPLAVVPCGPMSPAPGRQCYRNSTASDFPYGRVTAQTLATRCSPPGSTRWYRFLT